ncbi:MAG: response regulator [Myxococcaceae bacterium]|jgi:CheY-like chemotaxis protein|nr:response regulator [Myxococcaceae bacterium]
MSRARVLVVDDEAEVCDLVARTLTRAGFEVLSATSGEAGLGLLDAGPIDCLIVDKHLPGMHGGEVMAQARQRLPRLAVVLISGHPEPLSFDDARPDVTLSKPFRSLATIEEAVVQALAAAPPSAPVVETLKERLTQVVAELAPLRRKRD